MDGRHRSAVGIAGGTSAFVRRTRLAATRSGARFIGSRSAARLSHVRKARHPFPFPFSNANREWERERVTRFTFGDML